jgi:uncharacterized protein (DUF4415 family)
MDLSSLSITELKQMLARVNHDLKMNKPTIKRTAKVLSPIISEYAECNIIAQKFTGKTINKPVENGKLIADIQIQKDILDFLNNGGHITTRVSRKKIKPLSVSSSIISL